MFRSASKKNKKLYKTHENLVRNSFGFFQVFLLLIPDNINSTYIKNRYNKLFFGGRCIKLNIATIPHAESKNCPYTFIFWMRIILFFQKKKLLFRLCGEFETYRKGDLAIKCNALFEHLLKNLLGFFLF